MKKFSLIVLALGQIMLAQAQWALTGNSGTNPATNFVGTTDTSSLVFRVNNTYSGIISYNLSNTGLGYNALARVSTGTYNVAVGTSALLSTTTQCCNTAVGFEALENARSTSGDNSAFGYGALYNNSSGTLNTAVGLEALATNYTGTELIALGANADVMYDGYTNSIAIGYETVVSASNEVRIGNSSTTSIGGYVAWSNLSDGRFKKNVAANVPGLTFINQLQPVTYNLDATGIDAYLHPNGKTSKSSPAQQAADQANLKAKEKFIYSGFIAQDVEATAKKLGYQFSGVDAPKNGNDLYSLRYSDFVVPLVKAVQELSSQNSNLQSQVDSLQSQIASIQQQIAALKNPALTSISGGSSSFLQQNAPNPFNSTTLINYYIPSMNNNAQMVITSSAGQVVKSVILSNSGSGQVTINAGELAAGTYFYTLYIDGKLAGTKQMVLTK
jgi:hypothetical protein